MPIKKKKKSILNLGGVAKGRKIETGSERKFVKRIVSKRIAKEGVKSGDGKENMECVTDFHEL